MDTITVKLPKIFFQENLKAPCRYGSNCRYGDNCHFGHPEHCLQRYLFGICHPHCRLIHLDPVVPDPVPEGKKSYSEVVATSPSPKRSTIPPSGCYDSLEQLQIDWPYFAGCIKYRVYKTRNTPNLKLQVHGNYRGSFATTPEYLYQTGLESVVHVIVPPATSDDPEYQWQHITGVLYCTECSADITTYGRNPCKHVCQTTSIPKEEPVWYLPSTIDDEL